MTPVAGIRGSTVAAAGRPRDGAAPHEAATASGRALIALQPIARSEAQTNSRPQSGDSSPI